MGVQISTQGTVERIFSERCCRCGEKLPGEKVLGKNKDFHYSGERHYCAECWIDRITEARAMARGMLRAHRAQLADRERELLVGDMIQAATRA